ncbi:MAG TPA: molybdopterin-dependent oxidoreductase, partial [Actinomycetota bacterium]|nr:molybdopterin-dependent oxidoreductase [Actinomycetota bacterium]
NDRGALRAGLHPRLLPGGRAVEDDAARARIEVAWGTLLPGSPGRDTDGILRAAAAREIDVLFLVGVDPLRDFPDARLARQALENVEFKVVIDIDGSAMAPFADAMLPAAPYLEKDGHYTDWEGRVQRLRPVRAPLGLARSEWEIFQELSEVMGKDMGFHSLDALHEEMGALYAAEARSAGRPREVPNAPSGGAPARQQPPRSEELILFSYPLLVDEGKLSAGADTLKEALEDEAFVELHAADAERLGVADGESVRVRTEAGEAELPARISDGVAPGTVFVPWNQPDLAANTLLSGRLTASVAVESIGAEVTA